MGLDCYVVATIGRNDTEKEVGYFRKNWNLHHWMIEQYISNDGVLDSVEDGYNCQRVKITPEMLALLFNDVVLKQNQFLDSNQYEVNSILVQIPEWVTYLHDGFDLLYYGSY